MLDGESLVPLVATKDPGRAAPPADRPLVWHMPHQWGAKGPGVEPFTSIRRGNWKLLWFHDGPRVELYDLTEDLGETRDLAADRPDVVRRLLDDLDAWYDRTGASRSIDRATGEPIPMPSDSVSKP